MSNTYTEADFGILEFVLLRLFYSHVIQDHRKQSDDKSKKDNYSIFYTSVPPKTAQIVPTCFKSQIKGHLKNIKHNNYSDFHATVFYVMFANYKQDHP